MRLPGRLGNKERLRTNIRAQRMVISLLSLACALWNPVGLPGQGHALLAADDSLAGIRRAYVPADQPDQWPTGSWQPLPLADLERQLDWLAASRRRPRPFLERAEYSATYSDGELREARLTWHARRPDSMLSTLAIGQMSLNIARLVWSDTLQGGKPATALWGTTPDGSTAIVVDRSYGKLTGEWSLTGRRLAASAEFDLELPAATMSRIVLKIPTGLVLSSSVGETSVLELPAEQGCKNWEVNLGSRKSTRLRIAALPDPTTARALTLVRSSLNYVVRSEAVRVLAEFAVEPLESRLREIHLDVDPEIQMTSVEYGDGGAADWKSLQSPSGGGIVIQLPDSSPGEVQTVRAQGIAQTKPFAIWTLPRIRVRNAVEDAGKATLRFQPPLQVADVRTDGYVQTELTTSAADGETLVFRQLRRDGTITIVPGDSKPDLACRVATLLNAESNQWSLVSQMEWTAASGSAFEVECLIPEHWEIVDVRPAPGEDPAAVSGWDVAESGPERRLLHVYFLNALDPDHLQKIRIAARRLPPGPAERINLPPLAPARAADVAQYVIVTTGPEWRPVAESASEIERLTIRELPEEVRRLDFLSTRLSDRHSRFLAFRTLRPQATTGLMIEPFERNRVLAKRSGEPESATDFTPDSPPEPETAAARSPAVATIDPPVSLSVRLQVADSSAGFDHYRARVRVPAVDDRLTFRWTLAAPAELIGVTVAGRQVQPVLDKGTYSIDGLPLAAAKSQQTEIPVVELDYRVPAKMHSGPNARQLILPAPTGPVLQFELELVVSDRIRLDSQPAGLRLAGFEEAVPWYTRLLGPFARPSGAPIFNPFSLASWSSLPGLAPPAGTRPAREHIWHATSAALPQRADFVIWNADEANWLSVSALALCALAVVWARVARVMIQRRAACLAILCFCFCALTLRPVPAEIAGSALTGLVLATLLPSRALEFAKRPRTRTAGEFPMGSTQSFIPLARLVVLGMLLGSGVFGLVVLGLGLLGLDRSVHAQEDRKPALSPEAASGKTARPVFDVLIPVDNSGTPDGETPLAYVSPELSTRLRRAQKTTAVPPYLIGSVAYEGRVDDSNQLLVLARYEVHILTTDPVVRVQLPVGNVNLGGPDACLVDGQPHPVIAPVRGTGLLLELPGCEPGAIPPAAPQPQRQESSTAPESTDGASADGPGSDRGLEAVRNAGVVSDEDDSSSASSPVRTCRVELRLHPPVEAGRSETSSALVSVPPGCQTQASLTSAVELAVMGIIPIEAARFPMSQKQSIEEWQRSRPSPVRREPNQAVQIRPVWSNAVHRVNADYASPAGQLKFFWSKAPGAASPPPAEVQAGISCLADVSPALVQLRNHIAYHVLSGQVDSLTWNIPAGYVLQSVQAPQLAGSRFRAGRDGGREMLIEFSRPHDEDFSVTATFVLPIDRQVNPLKLPLIDPLSAEAGKEQQIGLRFHQFALRQAADVTINVSAADVSAGGAVTGRDQLLKPRPVKEFLKEWNAAGARPQQAFDLDRLFALQLDVESITAQPGVRASSEGHFHAGRLDWIWTAEIERPLVGQFVYRLHVDPRLKIRSVSVHEDGAERLLRPTLLRDTLVLLLNDQSTRTQTLRLDASLPLSAAQELELPRIRLAGATPGPEHITLYRDADLTVKLANPEDFPLPPAGSPTGAATIGSMRETGVGREILIAKLDCLPEQANPRVEIEPVLPEFTCETAFIIGDAASAYQLTTCVRFNVKSGRAETFKIEVPESYASRVDVRSIPASRIMSEPPVAGHITLAFQPDEPVGESQFVVVLTGAAELKQGVWQMPAVTCPGVAESTSTLLAVPGKWVPDTGLESVVTEFQMENNDLPEWITMALSDKSLIAPAESDRKMYRWQGQAPQAEFRVTREGSSKTGVDSARIDLWMGADGSLEGWLGLRVSEDFPSTIEFDWPARIDPTAVYFAGEFHASPSMGPETGSQDVWTVPLPHAAKGRLVWIAWRDREKSLASRSASELTARVPWPRGVPVDRCTMKIHAPPDYRVDPAPPPGEAGISSTSLLPALLSSAGIASSSDTDVSIAVAPRESPRSVTRIQAPSKLRIIDMRPRSLLLSVAVSLLIATVCWKTARFWHWLTRHEKSAWIVLAVIWTLWLEPGWVGPLVVVCVCAKGLFRRDRSPAVESSPASQTP